METVGAGSIEAHDAGTLSFENERSLRHLARTHAHAHSHLATTYSCTAWRHGHGDMDDMGHGRHVHVMHLDHASNSAPFLFATTRRAAFDGSDVIVLLLCLLEASWAIACMMAPWAGLERPQGTATVA